MISVTTERRRLAALRSLRILDTPREHTFERITGTLARFLDVPSACISLVDEDRVWFKSAHGVDLPEVARERGLCVAVIERLQLLHLRDAAIDPVSSGNWMVTDNGLRFYVGAPLTTFAGECIGTLCAFGPEPRDVSDVERDVLEQLARLTMFEIVRRAEKGVLDPCVRGQVLVVDGDEMILTLVQRALHRSGYGALTANNRQAALRLLHGLETPLAALILDTSLPELQFADTLKAAMNQSPQVPVILSGSRGTLALRFAELAPDHFLEKPFGPAELTELLAQVVSE